MSGYSVVSSMAGGLYSCRSVDIASIAQRRAQPLVAAASDPYLMSYDAQ